jgi:putative ABC transport system permease protein
MNIIRLSWINLFSNKLNTLLSILLMTFGVGIISLLLLINYQVEQQLQNNLRGIDMVVGSKGSPLQLILSSVYHIDNPTGNIPLREVNKLKKNPMVDTAIPLSLGDSYKGFRIVGTTHAYIKLYKANLTQGKLWETPLEVVIGSKVAEVNNLDIGVSFHGSHGLVEGGETHNEHSYVVVGILKPSNSVVDKLILTGTESIWKVHDHGEEHHHKEITKDNHTEETPISDEAMITAMLVKFRSPIGLIQLPRAINETTNMQAAVPAFEISRLVDLMGIGFKAINSIALVIIIVSGLSIFIGLYNALNKRRKELALIRVHGASRWQLVQLILQEGMILTLFGVIFGLILSRIILWVVSIFFETNFGSGLLYFNLLGEEIWLIFSALLIGFFASMIPTVQTYYINITKTLADV